MAGVRLRDDSVELMVNGEALLLHPERAVVWPARRTVIVADTHFGKSALFRHHGIAVPVGSDEHDRGRLNRLVREAQAERLIILGDFLHGPLDSDSRDARELESWSAELRGTTIVVIAGNHDRGVAERWLPPVLWRGADLLDPPFRFTHDADKVSARGQELFTMSGHIHPVARMGGQRKRAPRIPIFWQRAGGLVLPSFGIFTGGYVVTPGPGDRVFAAGPQRVVRFL